jgi:hypothetical protein
MKVQRQVTKAKGVAATELWVAEKRPPNSRISTEDPRLDVNQGGIFKACADV